MTNEELKVILERHAHWLAEDVDGWEDMRANLEYADLEGLNLRGAKLILAKLTGANFKKTDLRGADFRRADLKYACFDAADLSVANLSYTDLTYTHFAHARLVGADLRNTDCRGADFNGANLITAVTNNADFSNACFAGATVPDDIWPLACPEKGEFTGWKLALDYNYRPIIVEIVVTPDAKRSSATGRKCRCNKAVIKAAYTLSGEHLPGMHLRSYATRIHSDYNPNFRYFVGDTIIIDDFDDNRWDECAKGFHFFITRAEAENYMPLTCPIIKPLPELPNKED